jgi:hypothetical protein
MCRRYAMALIIGADPGVTTALVTLHLLPLSRTKTVLSHKLVKGEDAYLEVVAYLAHATDVWQPDMVYCAVEDFVGGGLRTKDFNTTVKMLGFFEGLAKSRGWNVELQSPQVRNPFKREAVELLDQAGVPLSDERRHLIDALAHALAYVYRTPNLG